jgi:transcriptional regulator with XRE-family HTH domain
MKGIDLRLRRVSHRIKVGAIADAMGVSDSRISHIETRDDVTDEAARKYLAALATLTTVSPPQSPVEAA